MSFAKAIRHGYRHAFTCSGRASRDEYWWFLLFSLGLAGLAALMFNFDIWMRGVVALLASLTMILDIRCRSAGCMMSGAALVGSFLPPFSPAPG